jgi:hypothetical protein
LAETVEKLSQLWVGVGGRLDAEWELQGGEIDPVLREGVVGQGFEVGEK